MSTDTTTPATTPDARAKRARSRGWLWGVSGLSLIAAWVAYVVIAGGRDRVLAEAVLPDGTILRLEAVTFGEKQRFFVQKPPPLLLAQFGIGDPEISASAGFGELFPQSGVWLTRRDPQTGAPLDLDWLSHCTAIDANGWEHASRFVGRCHWDDPIKTTRHQESLFRDAAPFKPLPNGKYREIVVGTFLPLFEAQDGRFPLKVYNTQGEVVATFDAPYPTAPPEQQAWTPEPLPATQAAGDLSVTLERVDMTPQPVDASAPEKRLPTIKVQPQVTFTWQGEPSDDWRFVSENIVAVEDGLGNISYLDRCRLTPHVPAWKLGFLLMRKPDGRYNAHEEWDPGPIEVPAAGESLELELNGTIDGVAIHITRVSGPGKHEFTVAAPKCLGGISPPLAREGSGWKASAVHRPGYVDWTVESDQPFFVWNLDVDAPQSRKVYLSRVFDKNGARTEVDDVHDHHGNKTFLAMLKTSPAAGPITLKPTAYETRSVYFLIEPLREKSQESRGASGETASDVDGDH